MSISNAQAIRALLPSLGSRAPASGPYHGTAQAWRELILGAVPIVDSDGVLLEWDSYDGGAGADVYVPAPDTQQADGRYLGLRGDAEAAWYGAVGVPYSYDAVSGGPYGTIRDLGVLPVPSGQRDAGYSRVAGAAVTNATVPGVDVDLWASEDAFTIAAVVPTRGVGSNFIYRIDTSPNSSDWGTLGNAAGLLIRSNLNTIQVEIANDSGTVERRAVGSLLSDTFYIVCAGYERTSPGGSDVTLKIRVYDLAGTLEDSSSFVRSGYGPGAMTAAPTAVHDAQWVRTYPGVLLSDAEMDDIADGTEYNPGGHLARHLTGVRTGIVDPSSPQRIIVRAVAGTGAVKQPRRPVPR